MSRKHDKTFAALFEEPTRANLRWPEVVAALASRGVAVEPGGGSRFRLAVHNRKMIVHRPHPGSEMSKPLVERVRWFCERAGLWP